MEENKKPLTEEQAIRKERIRKRLFILLIVLDILLVAYLIFEMIMIFATKK